MHMKGIQVNSNIRMIYILNKRFDLSASIDQIGFESIEWLDCQSDSSLSGQMRGFGQSIDGSIPFPFSCLIR